MIIFIIFVSKLNAADYCEIGALVNNIDIHDHPVPYASEVTGFENLMGRHLNSVLVWGAWNQYNKPDFPTAELNSGVRNHDGYDTKTILHYTWEVWAPLTNVINGDYDNYITKFAQDCKSWQDPIRFRLMHEMITPDGGEKWYPWQDNPTEYVGAYSHIRQIFRNEGADNVEFVWAPNNYPSDVNVIKEYYPGPDNVDWLGMDGYNFGEPGNGSDWPNWQWFDWIFWPLYNTYIDNPDIFGDKPIMLAEFASVDTGGDKAAWITNAFERIKSGDYSKIDAFYWFNIIDENFGNERIDSSPEVLAAFQAAMADPYYTSHPVPEPGTILLLGSGLLGLGFMYKRKQ